MRAIIDLETRSVLSLPDCGIHAYAAHESTRITHFGYKLGEAATKVWQPKHGPLPSDLLDILADPAIPLTAHNAAGFERLILGGPPGRRIGLDGALRAVERWDCLAARSAQVGLPKKLEHAADALHLPTRKDAAGHALMMRVCRPRTTKPAITWWDDDERMERMAQYCAIDCEVEALLDKELPPLTAFEYRVWACTERANDIGIGVDRSLLARLVQLTGEAIIEVNAEISALTAGAVPRVTNTPKLTQWLRANNLEVEGCAKDIVADLLLDDNLDPNIQAVLELRQEGGGSSCKKTTAITQRLSDDGRIRGSLVYGGAPSTLRFSSTGAQLQNIPRHDDRFVIDWLLRDVADGATIGEIAEFHGPPLRAVSELLRPVFIARDGLHSLLPTTRKSRRVFSRCSPDKKIG